MWRCTAINDKKAFYTQDEFDRYVTKLEGARRSSRSSTPRRRPGEEKAKQRRQTSRRGPAGEKNKGAVRVRDGAFSSYLRGNAGGSRAAQHIYWTTFESASNAVLQSSKAVVVLALGPWADPRVEVLAGIHGPLARFLIEFASQVQARNACCCAASESELVRRHTLQPLSTSSLATL